MEFLRFGSSIPGEYHGCCAMCIIQNFGCDPDDKASIEIVCGDGGEPIGDNFAGLTYREIFETRLRIGTFSTDDMPNHGFLAMLTEWQVRSESGYEWLEILHENGFEFIRTIDNSVYSGPSLEEEEGFNCSSDSRNKNYVFGLFRNIGKGAVADPLTPPPAWQALKGGIRQAVDYITPTQRSRITDAQKDFHLKSWNKLVKKFYTKEQVKEAGVPVTFSGVRSKLPQQSEEDRINALNKAAPAKSAPFGVSEFVDVVA